MLLEMFVNELSLAQTSVDVPAARQRAWQFVTTMRTATSKGVRRSLHTPEGFWALPLANRYYWKNWCSDPSVDNELRRYFLSVATKQPFLEDDAELKSSWANIDCYCGQEKALGLKAAYVADGLALSIASASIWDIDSLVVEIQEIVGVEIESRAETVHHASAERHVNIQTAWIEARLKAQVSNGNELCERAPDFFPLLVFCMEIRDQMKALPQGSLSSIVRGLVRLNDYCTQWSSGGFDADLVGCDSTRESKPTLEKYGAERTFTTPDGHSRVFSWHAKVGSWRIYFDPVGPHRVVIGYVGKHLRTVENR